MAPEEKDAMQGATGDAGDAMDVDVAPAQEAENTTTENPGANGAVNHSGAPVETSNGSSLPAADSATEEPAAPAQASKPLCGICNENPGKYKCTRCQLPFCSVACNKIHRENHPPDPEPPADTDTSRTNGSSSNPPAPAAAAPDPRNPFSALDTSEHLQYLFRRYPSLPRQLLAIGAEADPPAEDRPASLKEALLAKAAAVGKPKKEQWNHDVGIRKGKDALRKARRAQGEAGEGLREYTELIVHLTSQDARNREAEALLRSQAAQRDSELIRRLIEEEKR